MKKLEGHNQEIELIILSPLENKVASYCTEGKLKVWEINNMKKVFEF